jgi:hypothetical protein
MSISGSSSETKSHPIEIYKEIILKWSLKEIKMARAGFIWLIMVAGEVLVYMVTKLRVS